MRSTSRSPASRVAAALAMSALGMALASACSNEEIVLATVGGLEAGSGNHPTRCVENKDCASTMFCSRHDCGDVGGTCEPRPVVCDEAPMPVCGCEGLTYWNDCLRRSVGTTAMRVGECADNARLCGKGGKPGPGGPGDPGGCPPGTACARLLPPPDPGAPPMCPPDVGGTCWVLPAICPERSGPDRWISCDPSRTSCKSTCEAIRSGEPHRRAIVCP